MKIGVLGGGQLGRMLALAGYELGLQFRFFDQHPDVAAGQVGELVTGEYADAAALDRFAAGLHCVTYEFENVPVAAADGLAQRVPVYPPPAALAESQDRLREKQLFQSLGIPTPAFAPVDTEAELAAAVAHIGLPAVLKTRRMGYDGKGQAVLRSPADVPAAWSRLGGQPLILEAFVPFEREVSLIAVRSTGGELAFYPLVENEHRDGILAVSRLPAGVEHALNAQADDYARRVLERLHYGGVLTIEFFVRGGALLANEMAPRVHNSGHWTIDGAFTSQFENHLRAILGWPLGATAARGPVVMYNLVGALPDPRAVLAIPGACLHLYGKAPRPGRKVGHITLLAPTAEELAAREAALRQVL